VCQVTPRASAIAAVVFRRHEREYLALARGQRCCDPPAILAHPRALSGPLQQIAQRRRRDQHLARRDPLDRIRDLRDTRGLDQVSGHPRFHRVEHLVVGRAAGEHHDLGVREAPEDLRRRLRAAPSRKPLIHEDHVGPQLLREADGFLTAACARRQLKAFEMPEDLAKALRERGVVVDDHHPKDLSHRGPRRRACFRSPQGDRGA